MADLKIKLRIVTPEKTVCEEEIYQATLPVADGLATILPNHRSYIASLNPGEIITKKNSKTKEEACLFVAGGFIEFNDNNLIVLSDEAERVEEIDIDKAEEARKRAEELKNQKVSMDDTEFARVAAAIQRESARIKVARRHGIKTGRA